jgi:PIN domain nuclease of toxin-antitoxin system
VIVLDASAILALLNLESGADVVARHIDAATVCTPNVTEVVTKLIDRKYSPGDAERAFAKLSLIVAVFDQDLALRAGAMRAATAKQGLSLADRACLALAEREGVPAMTADKAWAKVDLGIKIYVIR